MTTDEQYMARCIQLARCGEAGAPPNPMVGAVIVQNDRIIGEGYHIKCGGPHAEVNAFASVRDGSLLPESTLYVSLEPCAHYGKTPPCASLVVEKKVRRVVIGCVDSFAKVQGRGIQMIRDAGIDVEVGVLEEECRRLNRRFFTFHAQKRPYITLKWAQTADGIMGIKEKNGPSAQLHISPPETMRRVHHLRAINKAILVGYNTALLDNPSLTIRHWVGENPLRVVIDPNGQLPATLNVFNTEAPTLVFGYKSDGSLGRCHGNVEFCPVAEGCDILSSIMAELYNRNIQSLLVEGGRATHLQFLDRNLWDEIHVEQAGMPARHLCTTDREAVMAPVLDIAPSHFQQLGSSRIYRYFQDNTADTTNNGNNNN